MMSSSADLSPSKSGNEKFKRSSSPSPSETVLDMPGTTTTMSKRRSSSLTREDILSMARVEYARRLSQFTLSQMRKQQQQVFDGGGDPTITSRDSSGSSGSSGDDSSRHVEQ